MKILSVFFGSLVVLISLVFALSNQQEVSLSLWPFGVDMTAPLYLMTLGALGLGLILGGGFVWLHHLPQRFMARRLGKDVVLLSDKLVELERELSEHRARAASGEPPLLAGSKWRFWERF